MPISWTTDQIIALSPDAASTKAGKGLAAKKHWVTLGSNEQAVWGECQGSAKDPYRTQIDLSEPAFKCNCPSRKFPCKHGLGLFLLRVEQENVFTAHEPPAWVVNWLVERVHKAEQKSKREERKASGEQPQPDPEAQAKRAAQREAKVAAGLAELELWLKDRVRQGIASLQHESFQFWDSIAARMVDAQAPGLARMLRDLAGLPNTGEGWQEHLLERMGKIHLILEGYKRIQTLPSGTQADIRSLIGWTTNQEELLGQAGVRDVWEVLGQRIEEEDRLRTQRTWLRGETTGRFALVLSFAAFSSQPLDKSLVPNTSLEAELVFFPSGFPLRALVKTRFGVPPPLIQPHGFETIGMGVATYAKALTQNPWIETFPLLLKNVVPHSSMGKHHFLQDRERHVLPLATGFEGVWQLLAISGGHPITVFGEWNGKTLLPLSAWAEQQFVHFFPEAG
ncbi:MAG: SWIM zinc finger family protein [Blastocatellia bacterium]|nr:SWIM zinc finger family protein [Blastocatellia bacterium]